LASFFWTPFRVYSTGSRPERAPVSRTSSVLSRRAVP